MNRTNCIDTKHMSPMGTGWRTGARKAWRAVLRGIEILSLAMDRARQRRALAGLDDRMLKDIGISRYDVEREIRKRPWQP